LICQLIISGCVLTSLVAACPLDDIFGESLFWIFGASIALHNNSLTLGGIGIALFRMILVEYPVVTQVYITAQNLSHLILATEHLVSALIFAVTLKGVTITNTILAFEFFRGHSAKVDSITMMFRGTSQDDFDYGMNHIATVVIIYQFLVLAEMAIYLRMFYKLYLKDQRMVMALSVDAIKKRNLRNAITLSGQAISFLFETMTTMLVMILLKKRENSFLEPACLPILIMWLSASVSFTQLASSPEIRRFVKEKFE